MGAEKIELIPGKLNINIVDCIPKETNRTKSDLYTPTISKGDNGKDTLSFAKFAKAYIEDNKCESVNGVLYSPDAKSGILSDDVLEHDILLTLTDDLGFDNKDLRSTVTNLAYLVKRMSVDSDKLSVDPIPNIIPFTNGDLIVGYDENKECQEWTFEFGKKRILPYRLMYDFPLDVDRANCPEWDRLVARHFNTEDNRLCFGMFCGSTLLPENGSQIALCVNGESGCGKTQLLEVLVGLLGPAAAVSIDLKEINDTFGLEGFDNKLLIYADEMLEKPNRDVERLKQLISAGKNVRMRINEKNKPHRSIRIIGSVATLTNHGVNSWLSVGKDNSAIARRVCILDSVAEKIPEENTVNNYGADLIEKEHAGFIRWELIHLYKWFENKGHILLSNNAKENQEILKTGLQKPDRLKLYLTYDLENDVAEHKLKPGDLIATEDLYEMYGNYCFLNGYANECVPFNTFTANISAPLSTLYHWEGGHKTVVRWGEHCGKRRAAWRIGRGRKEIQLP